MNTSRAQIIATIGPASMQPEILKAMIEHQMDIVRINFSWVDEDQCNNRIALIRQLVSDTGRPIPILLDLPGPRIQESDGHTYNTHAPDSLTEKDKALITCGIELGVEYIALSFVGGTAEIAQCRQLIEAKHGTQKIIAKIERNVAVEHIDAIIAAADAIMVARGDLGEEIPLEEVPFVQSLIIKKCNEAGKPVIVATQMMFSMVEHPEPTRAEVTDVATAILEGADAVMLSDETAVGKYPVETVAMMEKILVASERHSTEHPYHLL